jgi:hypothetical protein
MPWSDADIASLKLGNPVLYGMAKGPWLWGQTRREQKDAGAWFFAAVDRSKQVNGPSAGAITWAMRMALECMAMNHVATLGELLQVARAAGFELGPEAFGMYLGYEIAGCGVSWTDTVTLAGPSPIQLPRCTFHED